ncbi:MAG: Predicted membrane protein [uncultured Thiotrichaceae bacterium]|uniref:Predicted membrane protein n=1 Tax=uncultured Thiotrichaceae bacterium TaxID=298394 RepID=A0A6S6TMM4_9GAMM|nr:MAG: Predicted membrane protein [uncultured Thiotrichaceae bacterium]
MTGLEKKLLTWLDQGLINQEQLTAIGQYERRTGKSNSSHWWLYSLLILGSSIISLGIISLIAANWANIPDLVKLGTAFGLLSLLAATTLWQAETDSDYLYDALLTAFIILCLAVIGLIAQVFHLNGHWYNALLLWSAITLPVVLFAHQLFAYFLWSTLFIHAATWGAIALSSGSFSGNNAAQLPALFLLAPLLAAGGYVLTRLSQHLKLFRSSFFFWFQISGLVSLIFIDIIRSGGEMRSFELDWYIPAYIVAAILMTMIASNPAYRPLNKGLLISIILLLLLYFHPFILFDGETRYSFNALQAPGETVNFWTADDIRAPFLTILILFLYATHAGNIGHHRTFNAMTFLIGLRFVILYFQAMGGLAATGVGLILSGLMIIGIAWFWHKSRKRLQHWSEGLHE